VLCPPNHLIVSQTRAFPTFPRPPRLHLTARYFTHTHDTCFGHAHHTQIRCHGADHSMTNHGHSRGFQSSPCNPELRVAMCLSCRIPLPPEQIPRGCSCSCRVSHLFCPIHLHLNIAPRVKSGPERCLVSLPWSFVFSSSAALNSLCA
jgi:hypothetical protein